jgi:hypothetical protein
VGSLRPLLHRLVLERSIWHCNFEQLCLQFSWQKMQN